MRPLQQLRTEPVGTTLVVRAANPDTDLVTGQMFADLGEVVRRLRRDRRTRAVVLTGPRHGVFLPHFDIAEIAAGADVLPVRPGYVMARASAAVAAVPGAAGLLDRTPAAGVATLMRTHRTLAGLGHLPQVVIAAIDGDALGGGCEVALACDLRIVGDGDYLIGLPELTAGIPPGAGGSVRLTRLLGQSRAAGLILTGGALRPGSALRAGLVHEVVPAGSALRRALQVAEQVAALNPTAVAAAKRSIASAHRRGAFGIEAGGFIASAASSAGVDRMTQFVAASTPRDDPWRNRSWLGTFR